MSNICYENSAVYLNGHILSVRKSLAAYILYLYEYSNLPG